MLFFIILVICGVVADHRLNASGHYTKADGFSFPGSAGYNNYRSQHEPSALSKSIALAKQIDMLDSVDQFLRMIYGVPEDEMDSILNNRFADVERSSNIITPTPAKCEPELRVVSFEGDKHDDSLIYYPACTRVARCGGCCSHPLTSCQPDVIELLNFEVMVSKIEVDQISWKQKKIIALEVHKNCSCDCTIKAENCTKNQTYLPDECRCTCLNFDEESKCRDNYPKKLWNSNTCSCSCRYVVPCDTGYDFDRNTCSCQENFTNRWSNENKSNYGNYTPRHASTIGTKSVSVKVPPDANDSRRKHKDEPH